MRFPSCDKASMDWSSMDWSMKDGAACTGRHSPSQRASVGRLGFTGLVLGCWAVGCGWFGGIALAQRVGPKTTWEEAKPAQESLSVPDRERGLDEGTQEPVEKIAPDLQALYTRSQQAQSVIEFNSVIEGCRNIMGDSTRQLSERAYAKKLLSWAANRRGEMRSDMAGEMVRSQQLEEAQKLDQSATEDFLLSIEHDPARWRAHHNLGIAYALAGAIDEAIGSFTTTLELNPKFVDAYHNRGEMQLRRKDIAAAIEDFTRAIQLDPKDAGLVVARGNARLAQGETEAALADFQSAMSLAPESSQNATLFADTCQSLGRWKEAAEAYQKGIRLDPNHVRCLQNAAWMMATCPEEFYRDPPTALKTIEKAMQCVEGGAGPNLMHVYGVVQAANGEFAAAVATLNEAIQLTSDPSLRREIAEHRKLFERKKPFVQSASEEKPR